MLVIDDRSTGGAIMSKKSKNKRKPAASMKERRFWQTLRGKLTIGGVLSALLAVAGFLSPEVRQWACLELPPASELKYAQVEGETPFAELAASSLQSSFDGREVVFRGRTDGEAKSEFYRNVWSPRLTEQYTLANVRPIEVDPAALSSPFGQGFAPFVVLLDKTQARQWASLPKGTVVEVRGKAAFSRDMHPDSTSGAAMAGLNEQMARSGKPAVPTRMLEYADFYVVAAEVVPAKAVNDPRDRLMCAWRNFD